MGEDEGNPIFSTNTPLLAGNAVFDLGSHFEVANQPPGGWEQFWLDMGMVPLVSAGKIAYKPARFVDVTVLVRGKKVHRPYIEWYGYDQDRQQLVRKRLYNFPGCETPAEKARWATEYFIPRLNQALAKGLVFKAKAPKETPDSPLQRERKKQELANWPDLLAHVLKKYSTLRKWSKKTRDTYHSTVRRFVAYLKDSQADKRPLYSFTADIFTIYLEQHIAPQVGGTAFNNTVRQLKSILTYAKKESAEIQHITIEVQKQKVVCMRNTAFRDREIRMLREKMLAENPYLWYVVNFIMLGIRPKELRLLKCKDIYIEDNVIFLDGRNNKDVETRHIYLTQQARDILIQTGIEKAKPDQYLFGKKLRMYTDHHAGVNYFTRLHLDLIRSTGLDQAKYNLYSWRPTGASVMVNDLGWSITEVREQLGHSDLSTTDKYFRRAGIDPARRERSLKNTGKKMEDPTPPLNPVDPVLDKLLKLVEMFQAGLITADEFKHLKGKI